MKIPTETYESRLTAAAIDACSDRVRAFLEQIGLPRREVLRYALMIEEILLKTLDRKSETERSVRLLLGKRYLRYTIELTVDGEACNVFLNSDQSVFGEQLLTSLSLSPEYTYSSEGNTYLFRIRKKKWNPFFILLAAMSSALLLGFIGKAVIPADGLTRCVEGILLPLHDVFLNMLGCVAGPMIFLSVAWGIYGIGDAATLKQVGRKLLGTYIGTLFLAITVLGLLTLPFFAPRFESTAGGLGAASGIFEILLGIVPRNIFSPFIDGNTLQIIFLGIIVGIALLFLGKRTKEIAVIVEQINLIVQFLIEVISALVPYFIFIVLVEMIWSDTAGVLKQAGKLFIIFLGTAFALSAVMVVFTSLRNRVNPLLLLRKSFPTLITGITTASSAACFGINMTECRKELGIDEKIASFGLPLGMVTFKPTTALNYVTMAIFFAAAYDVPVSVPWLISMLFTSGILAIATPPIPGGAASAYTVLMVQLGIPAEAVAVALACDAIFDFVATGNDQFIMPFGLLNQASRLGLVDRRILTKKD